MIDETTHSAGADLPKKRGWRFWVIFPGLCLTSILCALDSTILSTALPTIAEDLHSSSLYVWTIDAYILTFTAIQPLYGQCADIFGRKSVILVAVALFLLGSGICGGAHNTDMLIAGRAVQGLGGGGLSILPAMVVCDLVSLRERQKYTGLVYGAFAIGTFIGPLVGGAMVDSIGWRWIFWLNLPVAGLALGLVVAFLKVARVPLGSPWTQLSRIDYIGNGLLMAAATSILIALSRAGPSHPWSSWSTLVPLLSGFVALPFFIVFEASSLCVQPTTPLRLFKNRTSALSFLLTFLHGTILYWASYFLPVYFQAVLIASPLRSGINSLAAVIPLVPFGIIGGFVIAKTGNYKINQIIGFGLAAISVGCFSILNQHSSTAVWVVLQIVFAAGAGIVLTAVLPAIQAPLPESDAATSTATWGFIQSLGFVCGVAIPSSIFETKFSSMLWTISDASVRDALMTGGAYEHASRAYIISLSDDVQAQVVSLYVVSLKQVWEVGSAFAALGFVVSFFLQDTTLREHLETNFGYQDNDSKTEEKTTPGES